MMNRGELKKANWRNDVMKRYNERSDPLRLQIVSIQAGIDLWNGTNVGEFGNEMILN